MTNPNTFAYFAGGCFWYLEAVFQNIRGVVSVTNGYAGGNTQNSTYKEVCSGYTGHAETIAIEFNPGEINYTDLLNIFFETHDPTTLNRQGNDFGTQYRSAIFHINETKKTKAKKLITNLTKQKAFSSSIVTQILPFDKFYPAEEYHQN